MARKKHFKIPEHLPEICDELVPEIDLRCYFSWIIRDFGEKRKECLNKGEMKNSDNKQSICTIPYQFSWLKAAYKNNYVPKEKEKKLYESFEENNKRLIIYDSANSETVHKEIERISNFFEERKKFYPENSVSRKIFEIFLNNKIKKDFAELTDSYLKTKENPNVRANTAESEGGDLKDKISSEENLQEERRAKRNKGTPEKLNC